MNGPNPGGFRLREYLGTLLFAAIALGFIVEDVRFSAEARHGSAVVRRWTITPRGGPTVARVDHRTAGGTVPAEIQSWAWHPRVGGTYPTVYAPDRPDAPILDAPLRRHFRALASCGFFIAIGLGEFAARRSRRQSEALERRLVA